MTSQEFLDEFGTLAESAEGVPKLRELILELAVRGKLVEQDKNDEPAENLLSCIDAARAQSVVKGRGKKADPPPPVAPDEIPYDLPPGWEWCRLGTLGIVGSSTRVRKKDWTSAGVPFLRAREIVTLSKFGHVDNELFISEEHHQRLAHDGITPEPNDVMITGVGTIGVPYVVKSTDRFYFKDASVLILKNIAELFPGYIRTFLTSPFWKRTIHKQSMGTTVHTLTISRATLIPFPLPPLAEQHRIVSKVDELMGLCDRLEAVQGERRGVRVRLNRSSLDRLTSVSTARGSGLSAAWQRVCDHFEVLYDTPETLPDLRQTILQLAVQGKLVPQDPNDEPAEAAMEGITSETERLRSERVVKRPKDMPDLDTVGRPFDVPSSWMWTQLADVLRYGPRNGYSPRPVGHETTVKSLTLSATTFGRFDPTQTKFIDENIEPDSYLWLQPGDFLIQRSNSPDYVGVTVVYDGPPNGFIYPDLMMKFRIADELETGFIELVMKCPYARTYFRTNATGTSGSMRKVNQSIVTGFPLPIPPLSEQKRIVSKVTHLLSQVTRLESTLTRRESTRTQLLTAAIHALLNGEEKK